MILTLVITSGLLVSGAADHAHSPINFDCDLQGIESSSNNQMLKAVIVNGETFPMIELPVVEITGRINKSNLITAEVIDGEIVPSITLDEVVITPKESI